MILVRDIFHLKYGQMDKVLPVVMSMIAAQPGVMGSRVLTDISGRYFTLVIETKAENVEEFRKQLQASFETEDTDSMEEFSQMVDSGEREFFNIEYEA